MQHTESPFENYIQEVTRKREMLDERLCALQKVLNRDDVEIYKVKKEKLRLKDILSKLHACSVPDIIA